MAQRPQPERARSAATQRNQTPDAQAVTTRPRPWGADERAALAAANGDHATRIQLLADLNRSAGNAAAQRFVTPAPLPIQRDPPDGGAGSETAEPIPAYSLTNARFTPHARLQAIAKGGPPMSRRDSRKAVKAVQRALLDLGYSLLRYNDDGKYGGETAEAIAQFRADRGITDGEGLNAPAMEALDKAAPATGQIQQHYLDYSRLFADDRLDATIAIGYDEGQGHLNELAMARDWFATQELTKQTGAERETTVEEAKEGISVPETWAGTRSVTYPDAAGARITKDIKVSITLVPPGTGAKSSFAKALNDSEITLYSGHARRGIGPDFDADKSPYENFVLGVGSALHKAGRLTGPDKVAQSHYVISKKNDLEAMKAANAWDPEKYRVWFFAACSSIAYIDELRGGLLPEKMDRHNLDIFGTTQAIPIDAGLTPVLSNLEGILAAETMEQIVDRMQRSSLETFRKAIEAMPGSDKQKAAVIKEYSGQMFMREGAGDNPVADTAP